jgi:hypothetical protein
MKNKKSKHIVVFILGMMAYAVGSFLISSFILMDRPEKSGTIEDWEQICFRVEKGNVYASVSPKGCYSTSCTRPRFQTGTAIVNQEEIRLETTFALSKNSRFPLPCVDNCAGGGSVQFNLGSLTPNEYTVWFRNDEVGHLKVFSGRSTPSQCFNNEDS